MRFVSWLWEQMDYAGSTAKFASVAWQDVNNGCANPRFTVTEWAEHFNRRHKTNGAALNRMLFLAYEEYTLSSDAK
jgi:hypothetical protein